MELTSVEICTGAGGQALGLERAGFGHNAVVEIDPHACQTLRFNRSEWNVIEADLHGWDPAGYEGVDLLAGWCALPAVLESRAPTRRRRRAGSVPRRLEPC